MDAHKKIPLVVVVGPTASGKTDLSIQLAQQYNGEIISADSMQIYKGMDIATAKPSIQERAGIPHHLMDFLDWNQSFSVSDYVMLANQVIDDIHSRGKLPILVGGTGLYVQSLIDNITFTEVKTEPQMRKELQEQAEQLGGVFLLQELAKIDPEYAQNLHPNNLNRIIRGIELYRTTGVPMTQHLKNSRMIPSRFDVCMIGLNYHNRATLYQRINQRVDIMVEQGLLNEAHAVFEQGDLTTAMQAIGYKELKLYFEGKEDLTTALDQIKQQSRRYAKRQLTWFRKDERIHWLYPDQNESIITIYEQSRNLIECFFHL